MFEILAAFVVRRTSFKDKFGVIRTVSSLCFFGPLQRVVHLNTQVLDCAQIEAAYNSCRNRGSGLRSAAWGDATGETVRDSLKRQG